MHRHIVHLHIPAFPIAVARVCRPELRNRPVVVAPPQSDRALLLAISPEARREGLFKGMPLEAAVKRCPRLTVLSPDPPLLERACRSLEQAVGRYTPLWEPSRPGHIYLDVSGTERLWGRPRDTAERLRREVKQRLSLSATAGLASNKMVSSIASRIVPGEGLLDVDHGREAPFMAPLRVHLVPGIDRFRRRALLEELHIVRVHQLAVLGMPQLKLIFGRQACLIRQRSLGIDPTPVRPLSRRPAVALETTLARDENDDRLLLGRLYELTEKCAFRLRDRGLLPRRAGLLIRYADQVETRRQLRLPGNSCWDFDLYAPLRSLFLKACKRRVRVRFMRVWFWDFAPPAGQLSLFPPHAPAEEKRTLLIQALDRVRTRHGEEAIRFGRTDNDQAQGARYKAQGTALPAPGHEPDT